MGKENLIKKKFNEQLTLRNEEPEDGNNKL